MTLDDRLLEAHRIEDWPGLVVLYTEAADVAPDTDSACFYLTQAYVFALQTGHPQAREINARLVAEGREAPLPARIT